MDVFSTLDSQGFVWDNEKASKNAREHGIPFEQAREAFLASAHRATKTPAQTKKPGQACIGLTTDYRLHYTSPRGS